MTRFQILPLLLSLSFLTVAGIDDAFAKKRDSDRWISVRMGFNQGKLDVSPLEVDDSRNGIDAGFSYGHRMRSGIWLETGLHYSLKGGKGLFDRLNEDGEVYRTDSGTYELDFITIPLAGRFDLGKKLPRAYVKGGVEVGFLTQSQVTVPEGEVSIDSYLGSMDFSLLGGIGGEIEASQGLGFFGELEYTHGLIDLGAEEFRGEPLSMKTRTLTFAIGMRIFWG